MGEQVAAGRVDGDDDRAALDADAGQQMADAVSPGRVGARVDPQDRPGDIGGDPQGSGSEIEVGDLRGGGDRAERLAVGGDLPDAGVVRGPDISAAYCETADPRADPCCRDDRSGSRVDFRQHAYIAGRDPDRSVTKRDFAGVWH